MNTKQAGCIQTILENSGRFSHYRCTLPIPKEVAHLYLDFLMTKGNKNFYVKTDVDFDRLWYNINLVQITVNDWKMLKFKGKKEIAISNCASFEVAKTN